MRHPHVNETTAACAAILVEPARYSDITAESLRRLGVSYVLLKEQTNPFELTRHVYLTGFPSASKSLFISDLQLRFRACFTVSRATLVITAIRWSVPIL